MVERRAKKRAKKRKAASKKAKPKGSKKHDFLANVPEDKVFRLCDGGVLYNMVNLRDALRHMNAGVFSYHCSKERNDFRNWARDVIKDKALAAGLGRCKTQKKAYQLVATAVRMHK